MGTSPGALFVAKPRVPGSAAGESIDPKTGFEALGASPTEKNVVSLSISGVVKSTVFDDGNMVRVEMGKVTFWSDEIPVSGPRREVINEKISVGGKTLTFCAAGVGNPHCVVPLPEISAEMAMLIGPLIEIHPNFPNRTNVQFMKVLDRANIQIEIWERGAGHTLASGSSSSAAAAVAHKLGLCDNSITVHMPGGKLSIEIRKDFDILMTGPVTRVAEGTIDPEIFSGGDRL